MQINLRLILFSIVGLLGVKSFSQGKTFVNSTFVIATHGDPTLVPNATPAQDAASFKKAKDAGFNLLTGEQFSVLTNREDHFNRYIAASKKNDLRFLAIDLRANPRLKVLANDNMKKTMKAWSYTKDMSNSNSSLLGYNLGDEPWKTDTAKIRSWARAFHESYPGSVVYFNLLPIYGFQSRKEYSDYLDSYLGQGVPQASGPDVVCYDFYPFCSDMKLRSDYYYNLQLIKDFAKDRPFWAYVLSTKHGCYSQPDAFQMGFEAFVPIVYGAKGLVYFTFETFPKEWHPKETFGNALLDLNHNPTPLYDIAKSINNFILAVVAPIVTNGDQKEIVHLQRQRSDVPDNYAAKKNKNLVTDYSGGEAIVSRFTTKKGEDYLLVVNTDNKASNLNITLSKKWSVDQISAGFSDFKKGSEWSPANANGNTVTVKLNPGELKVLRLKGS